MQQTLADDQNRNHHNPQLRGTPAAMRHLETTLGTITVSRSSPHFTPNPYSGQPGGRILFKADGDDTIPFDVSRQGGGPRLFIEPPPYSATRSGNTYTIREDAQPGTYILVLTGPGRSDTDDGEIRVGSTEDTEGDE